MPNLVGTVITWVLAVSIFLQFTAAILAGRLVWVTSKRMAWMLISLALLFMAVRRCITFYHYLSGDLASTPNLQAEWVALGISLLMVTGVILVSPLLKAPEQLEKNLAKKEHEVHSILDHAVLMVFMKDLEGRYLWVNRQFEKIFGLPVDQAVGKSTDEIFDHDTSRKLTHHDQTVFDGRLPMVFETSFPIGDTRKSFRITKFPLIDSEGKAYALCGIAADISDHKEVEAALRTSETRYQDLFENSPAALWEEDFSRLKKYFDELKGAGVRDYRYYLVEHFKEVMQCFQQVKVLDVNQSAINLFGATSKSELMESVGQTFREESFAVFREGLITLAEGQSVFASETLLQTLQGEPIHVLLSISVAPGFEESWGRVIVLMQDITERKRSEILLKQAHDELEQRVKDRTLDLQNSNKSLQSEIEERQRVASKLMDSLHEKEILLKEVNHRAKNNLQLISSLLWLQAQEIDEEKYKTIFHQCSNRIRSMALIHKKMYEAPNLAAVNFREYAGTLVKDLLASFGVEPGRIALKLTGDPISLDVTYGVPCGLLLQELIANSLKHAFPDSRRGEIGLSMKQQDCGDVEILYTDNGVGFPEAFDIYKCSSLGLQLVVAIAEKQLAGTLRVKSRNPTEIKIVFPMKTEEK